MTSFEKGILNKEKDKNTLLRKKKDKESLKSVLAGRLWPLAFLKTEADSSHDVLARDWEEPTNNPLN